MYMYIADPFGILRGYLTFSILSFSIIHVEYSIDEFKVILLFHCVLFLVMPFCVECTRACGVCSAAK